MTTRYLYNLLKGEPWCAELEYDPMLQEIGNSYISISVVGNTIKVDPHCRAGPEFLDIADPESLGRLEHLVSGVHRQLRAVLQVTE